MQQRQTCHPEEMILFLLALCCQDDSSTTIDSRDGVLIERFEDCLRQVTPVANSEEVQGKLND